MDSEWLEILGLTFDEQVQSKWIDLIHPDDAVAHIRRRYKALASGRKFSGRIRIRIPSGYYIPIRVNLTPVLDRAGAISHWSGIIQFSRKSLRLPVKAASGE